MIIVIQADEILKVDDEVKSDFVVIRNNDLNDVIAVRKSMISTIILDPYKSTQPSLRHLILILHNEREYHVALKANSATILFEMLLSNIDGRVTAPNPKIGFDKPE